MSLKVYFDDFEERIRLQKHVNKILHDDIKVIYNSCDKNCMCKDCVKACKCTICTKETKLPVGDCFSFSSDLQ